MATHQDFQPVSDKEERDPFFSQEDKQKMKSGFISSLHSGIKVATFIAPIVIVIGVGRMIGNFFSDN